MAEGREAFMDNSMMQDAVIRNFEVMGEATKRLSAELKQSNADIPWRQMAGFRDVLTHDYLRVELNEVWVVVERDLPMMKSRLQDILGQVENGDREC